jgi:hypothetical protein
MDAKRSFIIQIGLTSDLKTGLTFSRFRSVGEHENQGQY